MTAVSYSNRSVQGQCPVVAVMAYSAKQCLIAVEVTCQGCSGVPHWWYVVLVTLLLLPGFWTLFESCLLVKSTSLSFQESQKFSFIPRELDAAPYYQGVWLAHHFSLREPSLTLASVLSWILPDPDSSSINLSWASDLSLHCPLPWKLLAIKALLRKVLNGIINFMLIFNCVWAFSRPNSLFGSVSLHLYCCVVSAHLFTAPNFFLYILYLVYTRVELYTLRLKLNSFRAFNIQLCYTFVNTVHNF